MLDNCDHHGNQRIFVITGERIKALWELRLIGMRDALVDLTKQLADPALTDEQKQGYEVAIKGLTRDIDQESFSIAYVGAGNVRMSAEELDQIFRLTSPHPVAGKSKADMLDIFARASKEADLAMTSMSLLDGLVKMGKMRVAVGTHEEGPASAPPAQETTGSNPTEPDGPPPSA